MLNRDHALILAFAFVACAKPVALPDQRHPPLPPMKTRSTGLTLEIEGVSGDPGLLRFTLKNTSHLDRLWVNYRLADGASTSRFAEVWLDATHVPTERRVDPNCKRGIGFPTPQDYVHLGPGDAISFVRAICTRLSEAGAWRIVAHYQDKNPHPPDPPRGSSWFSGTITSSPIEILVPRSMLRGR